MEVELLEQTRKNDFGEGGKFCCLTAVLVNFVVVLAMIMNSITEKGQVLVWKDNEIC